MKKSSAREIVCSVGLCDRPEYYSGRGATRSDLNGDKLYAIYTKIREEHGTKPAEAFVTMVQNIKTLSATNFLNCFYTLERNDWKCLEFHENDIDLGPDGPERAVIGFATIAEMLYGSNTHNDTDYIRESFLKKLEAEGRGTRERERMICCNLDYEF